MMMAHLINVEAVVENEIAQEIDALLSKMAAICVFCGAVYPSTTEPERVEFIREHMLECERHPVREIVAAWRQATGCDSPEQAAEAWDRLDTLVDESAGTQPVQHVATSLTVLDRHLFEQRQLIGKQERELALLRELEAATFECGDAGRDVALHPPGDPEAGRAWRREKEADKRLIAAIAACRAAKEGK